MDNSRLASNCPCVSDYETPWLKRAIGWILREVTRARAGGALKMD